MVLPTNVSTKLLWLFTFAFVNPVLLLAYFISGHRKPSPYSKSQNPAMLIFIMAVIVLGFFNFPLISHGWMIYLRDPIADEEPAIHLQAASMQSSNGSTSSCGISTMGDAWLKCRNILIVNADNESLTYRICNYLPEKLIESPNIDNAYFIDVFKAETALDYPIPDMVLQVGVSSIKKIDLFASRTLDVKVQLSLNCMDRPLFSRCAYGDTNDISSVYINWNFDLDHHSTTTGYESQHYMMAVKQITDELAKGTAKMLEEKVKKYKLAPAMPSYMIINKPFQLPEFLLAEKPAILFTGPKLFNSSVTMFKLGTDEPLTDSLEKYCSLFIDNGWDIWRDDNKDSEYKNKTFSFFRANKDGMIIQIARPKKSSDKYVEYYYKDHSGSSSGRSRSEMNADRTHDTALYGLCYNVVPAPGRSLLLDQLLADDAATLDQLLAMKEFYNPQQKTQLFNRLQSHKVQSIETCMAMLEYCIDINDKDFARKLLKQAAIYNYLSIGNQKQADNIRNYAKRMEEPDLADYKPTQLDLDQLGYIQLTPIMQPQTVIADFGSAVGCYYVGDDGDIFINQLKISMLDDANVSIVYHQLRPGGSSTSSTGQSINAPSYNTNRTIQFRKSSNGSYPHKFERIYQLLPESGQFQVNIKPLPSEISENSLL